MKSLPSTDFPDRSTRHTEIIRLFGFYVREPSWRMALPVWDAES